MARARATRRKQEETAMIDEKKAQEKALETLTVWADASQRVLREVVDLGTATAKESVRLYGELQQRALVAGARRFWEPLLERAQPLAEQRDLLPQALGLVLGAVALALGPRRRGARRQAPPPRARGPVLEHALHLTLVRHPALEARPPGLSGAVL